MRLIEIYSNEKVPTLFFSDELDQEFNDYLDDYERIVDNLAPEEVPKNLKKVYVVTTDPAYDYRGSMPGPHFRTEIEPTYAVWVDGKNRVYLEDLVNTSDTAFAITNMGLPEFEIWARKAAGQQRAH